MRHFFLALFIFPCIAFCSEENFLLIDGRSGERLLERGPHLDERLSPCSTFKIVLSLMGYDSGVLVDEKTPIWAFQEGYDAYLESWKAPQSPLSWMKHSCVWYSKLLAQKLGLEKIQHYLAAFAYGNQDFSVENAWLRSSLRISPKEQVDFIMRMLSNQLPVSRYASEMTKALLFVEELSGGWTLFGKTGLGSINDAEKVGWFVGWVEKDDDFFPFAYNIRDTEIEVDKRVPRVKQLITSVQLEK